MVAVEAIRQALPDEFFAEFVRRGVRVDGRAPGEARALQVEAQGPRGFCVNAGGNVCLGSFALVTGRPEHSERLGLSVEGLKLHERGADVVVELTRQTLNSLFAAQLLLLKDRRVEVRAECLLDDGNSATAFFLCAQLCVAAALLSVAAELPLPLAEMHLFRMLSLEGGEFLVLDPGREEETARLFRGGAELICVLSGERTALRSLQPGPFSPLALQHALAGARAAAGAQLEVLAAALERWASAAPKLDGH